ncbi:hypothetical protein AAEO56_03220 [Flavobacterium sp. DGU11]|uniref:Uncharacterized protein n=1 Tax=Flavobacterium arundinis TaxID=3139143 RepID=A0ABU9HU74_9FLAO
MVNRILLFVTFLFLVSCSNRGYEVSTAKGDSFINEPGRYYLKKGRLIVREFEDGTLVYGVADKFNRVQHQQSIFSPFSDHQYWIIYLDTDENVWFYCADLQQLEVVRYSQDKKAYVYEKIEVDTVLPKAFEKNLNERGVDRNDILTIIEMRKFEAK